MHAVKINPYVTVRRVVVVKVGALPPTVEWHRVLTPLSDCR